MARLPRRDPRCSRRWSVAVARRGALAGGHRGPDPPAPDQPVGRGDGGDGDPRSDGVVFRGPVRGRALVAALLSGAVDAGVEVRTGQRVDGLVCQGHGVVGVQVGDDRLHGYVVLATGGFEHDPALVATHLGRTPAAAMGTPGLR